MESLSDAIDKRFTRSLVHLMKVIDPERRFTINETLGMAWDALTLQEQRRMYLYLKYKKWRGEELFGSPYEIILNCHPYPTNWNGRLLINSLMKTNKMVIAKYNGAFGTYTVEEARVWEMTDVKPLNF